jgi:hypothetical protein
VYCRHYAFLLTLVKLSPELTVGSIPLAGRHMA